MLAHQSRLSVWSRPTTRFVVRVSALMGVFLFIYQDALVGRLLDPWVELTVRATLSCLHLLGMEALQMADAIHHPSGFAYEVYYRCTGVLPVAVLTILTMAACTPLRRKLLGLAVGIPVLILLNLVRLVHLFYIGIHHPAAFGLAHGVLWEAALMTATLGLWWCWSAWAARNQSPP
jgi:exosortase/archaeosortase family protein